MRACGLRHRIPWARRGSLAGLALALGLAGLLGCATRANGPAEDPTSARARPINLSPRCLAFEPVGVASGEAVGEAFAPLPADARSRRLGPTLEAVVLPGPTAAVAEAIAAAATAEAAATTTAAGPAGAAVAPMGAPMGAGLQRLRWVTPVSAFASPTHARAAFFVWSLGELSADPDALRQRLRARGIALSTARLGDRVVLDLLFPASELEAALGTLRTLMAPEAIAPEHLESIRRELALLLLAEEAAPKAAARRLRRGLRTGEPAPGAKSVLDALDGESLRDALLGALHGTPGGGSVEAGHLLVYSGAGASTGADGGTRASAGSGVSGGAGTNLSGRTRTNVATRSAAIEAALDRLEEAVASWPGAWRSPVSAGGAAGSAGSAGGNDAATPARRDPEREHGRASEPEPQPEQTAATETPAGTAPAIHLLDQPGARQVELLATAATVGREATDRAALEMLASLLGDPLGGRLFRDLRERQGLAYEIAAEQTTEGDFEVSTRTRPERLGALMTGIESHWAALVQEPIEDCERAMLHARMHGLLALEADEPGSRLDGLVRAWAGPDTPPGLAARVAAYRAVSRKTLESVVRRWLSGPPEWLLVGDASRIVERLREAFPDRRIVVHDASLEIVREVGGP